jgi:alpha-glucosidase (family GH31 glycosyl hydrolase)
VWKKGALMFFYCTCSKDPKRERQVKEGRTTYRLVSVDLNGVCLDCNHYAVACNKIVSNGNDLYYLIMGKRYKEDKGYIKGGLSIKSQKRCINRGKFEKNR